MAGAQLGQMDADTALKSLPTLLEWTKNRTAAFRGASEISLLRNDGYYFLRMGGLIERADMTLRLLDVKYYVLLPETDVVGGGRDYHQWTSVLRATSALRAYHHVYKGDYTPWGIADFLILNATFPRSIAYCYRSIKRFLDDLAERLWRDQFASGGRQRDGGAPGRHRHRGTVPERAARVCFRRDRDNAAPVHGDQQGLSLLAMRLTVRHATTYTYDPPADRCALRLRLYPPSFDGQRVKDWKVSVNGQGVPPLLTTATADREAIWTRADVGAEIVVVAEGEVETTDTAGVVRGLRETSRPQVFLRPTPLTEADKRIEELAAGITGKSPLDRLHALFNTVADADRLQAGLDLAARRRRRRR